jgi:ribosomal protein L7/L12
MGAPTSPLLWSCSVLLAQAKDLVESAPAVIMKDIKKEDAEGIVEKLKELGGEVGLE